MKTLNVMGSLAAAALALGAFSTASAAPTVTVTTQCELGDVKIGGDSSLACAGAYNGVETLTELNGLNNEDWSGADPDPLNGWSLGGKWNIQGDFDTGSLELDSNDDNLLEQGAVSDWSAGNFKIDISPYGEVVITFKQATDYAYYYFQNDGSGTFDLSWVDQQDSDQFSHMTLFVRGTTEVPEPTTLALLGLGLVGMGLRARRRRTA